MQRDMSKLLNHVGKVTERGQQAARRAGKARLIRLITADLPSLSAAELMRLGVIVSDLKGARHD